MAFFRERARVIISTANKRSTAMRSIFTPLVLVGLALATETRVAGMGNLYQFILDDEALVIQDNPAYITRFADLSVTEMKTQQDLAFGKAYGGILVEKGPGSLGFYLNNPVYTFPTITDERNAYGLTLAVGSGKGFGWGLRLGYAFYREGDTSYTIEGNRYSFSPGLILPLGRGHISAFANISLSSYSDNSSGPDSVLQPLSELSNIHFGLRYASSGGLKIIAGSKIYRNNSGKKIGDSAMPDLMTGGSLFLGVNGNPLDMAFVAGGLTLDAYRRRGNGEERIDEARLLAGLGSEMRLGPWFIMRSNMSKFLFIYREERMIDPNNPYVFVGSSGFVGSFGMGMAFGPGRLDATVSEDLLYNGPYFMTGRDSDLVLALAFLYGF